MFSGGGTGSGTGSLSCESALRLPAVFAAVTIRRRSSSCRHRLLWVCQVLFSAPRDIRSNWRRWHGTVPMRRYWRRIAADQDPVAGTLSRTPAGEAARKGERRCNDVNGCDTGSGSIGWAFHKVLCHRLQLGLAPHQRAHLYVRRTSLLEAQPFTPTTIVQAGPRPRHHWIQTGLNPHLNPS